MAYIEDKGQKKRKKLSPDTTLTIGLVILFLGLALVGICLGAGSVGCDWVKYLKPFAIVFFIVGIITVLSHDR